MVSDHSQTDWVWAKDRIRDLVGIVEELHRRIRELEGDDEEFDRLHDEHTKLIEGLYDKVDGATNGLGAQLEELVTVAGDTRMMVMALGRHVGVTFADVSVATAVDTIDGDPDA